MSSDFKFNNNPVTRRLLLITQDWVEFSTKPEYKAIYWHVKEEKDLELLTTFFQMQEKKSASVFTLGAHSFVDNDQYFKYLLQVVTGFYEGRREDSLDSGINATWEVPPQEDREPMILYFFRVLESLNHHHPYFFAFFTFVLKGGPSDAEEDFKYWLNDVLEYLSGDEGWAGENIRFVFYDNKLAPWLVPGGLVLNDEMSPALLYLDRNFKSNNIMREMATESTDRGVYGEYRRTYVELNDVIKDQSPSLLEKHSSKALGICRSQRWLDQIVVVQLIAGAAYLSWKDHDKALEAYVDGEQAAREAIEEDHPVGHKLLTNILFAKATVYFTQKDYGNAAKIYAEAGESSTQGEDWLLAVEGHRMAAFCWEKGEKNEYAVASGLQALDIGENLEDGLRKSSTLPFAAKQLMALLPSRHAEYDGTIERLQGFYGEDWQDVINHVTKI